MPTSVSAGCMPVTGIGAEGDGRLSVLALTIADPSVSTSGTALAAGVNTAAAVIALSRARQALMRRPSPPANRVSSAPRSQRAEPLPCPSPGRLVASRKGPKPRRSDAGARSQSRYPAGRGDAQAHRQGPRSGRVTARRGAAQAVHLALLGRGGRRRRFRFPVQRAPATGQADCADLRWAVPGDQPAAGRADPGRPARPTLGRTRRRAPAAITPPPSRARAVHGPRAGGAR